MSRKTIKSKKNIRKKTKGFYIKTKQQSFDKKNFLLAVGYGCLIFLGALEVSGETRFVVTTFNIIYMSISYILEKIHDLLISKTFSFVGIVSRKISNVMKLMFAETCNYICSGFSYLNDLPTQLLPNIEFESTGEKIFFKTSFWVSTIAILNAIYLYGKCLLNMNKQLVNNARAKIEQYTRVRRFTVKCPLCNQINCFNNNPRIYGLSEHCKVCLDNNINILLPGCKHAILCEECLDEINYADSS